MQRTLSVLIILGLVIWAFLLWDHYQPEQRYEQATENLNDANKTDRCAEYRVTDNGDERTWSLGYEGRIRQLVHGCF
jgi:hypothetical protein